MNLRLQLKITAISICDDQYRISFLLIVKDRERVIKCDKKSQTQQYSIRSINFESTIMLRESSQGESSVMRVRLEGIKKPIRAVKIHYEYTLVK